MATKIILFVSSLPKGELRRERYTCPDGSAVEGAQTNEAPVCFLLERYPQVSEILCIVTPEAEPAYRYLCDRLKPAWPGLALRRIPYQEGEDFNGTPLSAILSAVRAGDEILLETTGGFRNAVMYLLLLSRVLSYVGVRTATSPRSASRTSPTSSASLTWWAGCRNSPLSEALAPCGPTMGKTPRTRQ